MTCQGRHRASGEPLTGLQPPDDRPAAANRSSADPEPLPASWRRKNHIKRKPVSGPTRWKCWPGRERWLSDRDRQSKWRCQLHICTHAQTGCKQANVVHFANHYCTHAQTVACANSSQCSPSALTCRPAATKGLCSTCTNHHCTHAQTVA